MPFFCKAFFTRDDVSRIDGILPIISIENVEFLAEGASIYNFLSSVVTVFFHNCVCLKCVLLS